MDTSNRRQNTLCYWRFSHLPDTSTNQLDLKKKKKSDLLLVRSPEKRYKLFVCRSKKTTSLNLVLFRKREKLHSALVFIPSLCSYWNKTKSKPSMIPHILYHLHRKEAKKNPSQWNMLIFTLSTSVLSCT